jgi:glycosyltransferase involved in cell wall biosynthesis
MHVITGLGTGGAEIMLSSLLSAMDRRSFESKVLTLLPPGPVAGRIGSLGVEVASLDLRRGALDPRGVFRARAEFRRFRPHVVQCWMYHANLLGGIAAALSGRMPVVWGIHHTDVHWRDTKLLSLLTVKACALLSRWLPARIVCCAESANRAHADMGCAAEKMTVITNGIDVRVFQPAPASGAAFRQELGMPSSAPVLAHLGRYHPQKDHRNLLRAVRLIGLKRPEVHFVFCGDGVNWENSELAGEIAALGVAKDRIHLLGRQEDVVPLLTTSMVVLSSSYGEAFPVVLGEAMACGRVCVTTNVGDCAAIVGDTGFVVPPHNPGALAEACLEVLDLEPDAKERLRSAARRRIEEHCSLSTVAAQYEALYRQLVPNPQ